MKCFAQVENRFFCFDQNTCIAYHYFDSTWLESGYFFEKKIEDFLAKM